MTPDVVCASYDMADASRPLFFVMTGINPAMTHDNDKCWVGAHTAWKIAHAR